MSGKSRLSAQERTELVLKMLSKEVPTSKLARQAGVSEQTLYRWRADFLRGAQDAMSNGISGTGERRELERMEAELRTRDQVIGELTIANQVLKNNLSNRM